MSKAEGKFSAICQVNSIQLTSTREASWDAVHGNWYTVVLREIMSMSGVVKAHVFMNQSVFVE